MNQQRTSPSDRSEDSQVRLSSESELTPDQCRRLSTLIANGQFALSKDRAFDPNDLLIREIRDRRKEKLLHFIATAIAHEICNKVGSSNEVVSHVKP